jgi:hypothetical protein
VETALKCHSFNILDLLFKKTSELSCSQFTLEYVVRNRDVIILAWCVKNYRAGIYFGTFTEEERNWIIDNLH